MASSKKKNEKCPLDCAIRRSLGTSECSFSDAVEAERISLSNLDEKSRREVRQYPEGDMELRKHYLGRKREPVEKKTLKDAEEKD